MKEKYDEIKSELKTIIILKKYEFLIRTFLIFLMLITLFDLSFLESSINQLKSFDFINWIHFNEPLIHNMFILFLLFYFFILLLFMLSFKTDLYHRELKTSFEMLSNFAFYYLIITQIFYNINILNYHIFQFHLIIKKLPFLIELFCNMSLAAIFFLFFSQIVGYFYQHRD